MEEKKIYPIDNEDTEQELERFYTILEPKEKELTYSDEGFNEVYVNFVGIETIYFKYHSLFPLKSKLHTHIKSECMKETLSFAFLQPSLSIPVMVLKAVHISLRLGFKFRGWTYAIATITFIFEYLLQSFDPNSTTCLDISYGIILVDRDKLLNCFLSQKSNIMSISLKVKGIDTFKYKSLEFATLSSYFPNKNNFRDLVYVLL